MTWIEFAGPVGAGKSSLIPMVISEYSRDGRRAVALDEAYRKRGLHVGPIRMPRRIADAGRASAFLARHPRLAWQLIRAIAELPLPLWHRRIITGRLVALAVSDRIGRHSGNDAIFVDEGWVHRAINLFAWGDGTINERLDAYLGAIPRPDAVVFVDAPETIVGSRLLARGLPRRLRSRDADEIELFLDRARRVVESSSAWMDAHGVRVIRVTNDSSLSDAARHVGRQLLLPAAEDVAA